MSEFEREGEEYGCSPILAQWGNVIDMLMAQTEPKNQKREGKMWEKKWSQICIESGWDNPEKISVALAPKIRDMEKRAHDKLKRHVEGEDKVKWINKRRQTKQEEEYRTEVRLWTKLAITATALSPFKKGRGEHVKAEASEKEMKRQSGNGQGRALEQMGLAPPPGLYPDLKSVEPPPYVPQQGLQQVQVMVKEGAVEVEIEEMDTMNERIKLLSARMDAAEQQGRSLLRGELEQEGSMHEGDEKSREGSVIESDDEGQVKGTHRVCIEGVMTMNSPVASRTRQKQTVQRSQSEASGRYSAQPEAIGEASGGCSPQLQRQNEQGNHYTPHHQLCSGGEGASEAYVMPLVAGTQGPKYQPWSHSNMTAVLAKLPPITSGGGRWLNKLMALCHGTTLAVGDLRCLLGQIFTVSQMRAFEEDAGMSNTQNNLPYTAVCTSVGSTLRKQFPTPPTTYQNIKFRIKPGEAGAGYYFRCAAEWEQMVEENSLNNPVTRDIFRSAVMSGAPNGVKQAMEGNPDIPGATNEVWERHLVFHIDRTVDKLNKEEEDVEKLKNQLLKLQLDQARNNGPKKTKQMSQQSVNDPPTPSVIPPYFGYDQGETNHPTGQQGGNWGGNRGQLGGNMGFRGGRGRGGGQQRGVCFVCGSSEHWKADCPSQQRGGQFSGPPARGWGPNRGGPGGRSRGPYTSRYSGQRHPSPANLQAPMHPTWGPEGDAGDC